MSWGDDPTNLYSDISNLDEADAGILNAVGFDHEEDNKDWKGLILKMLKNKRPLLPALLGLDKTLDEMISNELSNESPNQKET